MIKNRQLAYRIKALDGTWLRVPSQLSNAGVWVRHERQGTIFSGLNKVKKVIAQGALSVESVSGGLPVESFKIYEYEVVPKKTGRNVRLSEIDSLNNSGENQLARKKFEDWLDEVKVIVEDRFEVDIGEIPEFDREDAFNYFKEGSSPSLYFKECLSEFGDGDPIKKVMNG